MEKNSKIDVIKRSFTDNNKVLSLKIQMPQLLPEIKHSDWLKEGP